MRHSAFLAVAAAILLAISPVAASSREDGVLLSPTDYVYLLTQGVPQDSPVLLKMSPKELYRLHQQINDEKAQRNPQSRSDAVRGLLAEFESNQAWENANPGRLWDAEKRRVSGKSNRN